MKPWVAGGWVELFLVILLASPARAEHIWFESGYPKPDSTPGKILVKGWIYFDDAKWKIPSKDVTIEVWPGGGAVHDFSGKIQGTGKYYSFEGFAQDLKPGVVYSLFVEVKVVNGGENFSMRTEVFDVILK